MGAYYPDIYGFISVSTEKKLFFILPYIVQMSVRWKPSSQTLPRVQEICNVFDVTPIPPDPVEIINFTLREAFPQGRQYFVTLRYNWTAPIFPGEGITSYEVWLEREPAPMVTESSSRFQQLGANNRSAETRDGFISTTNNFIIYFQVLFSHI